MHKEFYTEKDIEDLYQRGIRSLRVTEYVLLTELAYEKAKRLGLELLTDQADNPPAAPVRPYLSEAKTAQAMPTAGPFSPAAVPQPEPVSGLRQGESDVEKRIRSAVIARLGNQVDEKLLDSIIHRVVKGVGLK